jgi:hypothetical protein
MLKSVLAETTLVQNLKKSQYMENILNGCKSLEERFTQIDAHLVQKEMNDARSREKRILSTVKKTTQDFDLINKIATLYSEKAK